MNQAAVPSTSVPGDSQATLPNGSDDSSSDPVVDDDQDDQGLHEYIPPFLVRSKSKQEREEARQEMSAKKDQKSEGLYAMFHRVYEKYSTSVLLENTASVARDHLANERTFLAWLRTSLSMITVGVAITQLYHLQPTNGSDFSPNPGRALGATFVVFSILFLYFANARYFHSQIAMTKGHFPASRGSVIFGSTCVLGVLIAMFVVILTQPH